MSHKRGFDVMMVDEQVSKRPRFVDSPALASKKRALQCASSPNLVPELERARDQGRQEAHRHVLPLLHALTEERDRLAREKEILKAGVHNLNHKRTELMAEVERLNRVILDQATRHRELLDALHRKPTVLGVCRFDNSHDRMGEDDDDVY